MPHGFKSFVEVPEARQRLLQAATPIDRAETVPLAEADDRIVGGTVRSPTDLPREDRAAMDGWAVVAETTHAASERTPATIEVADDAGPGRAVAVHTGSPLPDGADAVVMVEEVERSGGKLDVFASVPAGRHVADRGEDVAEDEVLFEPGHRLRPSDLGLLRAVEIDDVEVVQRPRVRVVPTGDEVVDADPGPGQTVESNGTTLKASLSRWGCRAERTPIVPDDPDALRDAVTSDDPDLVLTVGGTSVGRRDRLPDVLDELGDRLFHGVALRPGHPVGAWRLDDRLVVTVPGDPVAALVTATLLVRPLVRQLGRRPDPPDPTVEARLTRKVPSALGDLHVVRVRLEDGPDGPTAEPTRSKGAGVISSVTAADGVVLVPPRSEGLDEGARVEVVLWE